MEIGTIIHDFRVVKVRELAEIDARMVEMVHDKSGAQLVWLDRNDENKTFCITFKTLPEDSTGVFHILEHSVLGGSDKYPVKEPFVELLKSSVQTFLNAMTYPDKTVYPVSSRNDKDFLNLVGIYLDGVFHPSIYKKPEIFRQEGWRYELRENEPPVYQGVVFNEMKGAYASPDSVLEHELNRSMFPDNCYRHESGGHPERIPDLTYEQFIEHHKKFYHPSNARIALCGRVDLDSVLPVIDEYLNEHDRKEIHFDIPIQAPVEYTEREVLYEIGRDEPEDSKAIVACGLMLGSFDEQEKILASYVLSSYLAGDNESPLKRAILDKGLGQDVRVYVYDGIQQPYITWQVWNTDKEKLEDIKKTVGDVINAQLLNGLDKESLKASFNRFAFNLRDRDGSGYPRSLGEALTMLDTWLYGGDPAQNLLVEDTLNRLESKLESGYFESLLKELIIDNPHKALVTLVPSRTLGEEKLEKEKRRLESESALWTPERIAELKEQAEILTSWQQAPDSEEALATIPLLKLSDLNEKPEKHEMAVTKNGENTILRHATGSKLVHMNLFFSASDAKKDELPYMSLLAELLSRLPTELHSGSELQTLVKQSIGRLNFDADAIPGRDPSHVKIFMTASIACLKNQADNAVSLLAEILTQTLFADKKLLRDILNQTALDEQMALASRGNRFAVTRASAYQTAHGAAREALAGYSFAEWIKKQSTASDEELDGLLAELATIAGNVFTSDRLTVSVSDNVSDEFISELINKFPKTGTKCIDEAEYEQLDANGEGIIIPAAVGFAAKGANMKLHGRKFHGSLFALTNILNYSYLWNEIRVQGGAYGCGFGARDDGDVYYYSYRDPQPGRSLDIFDRAAEFIREYCAQTPDMTKHILGSVTDLDPLLNAEQKMAVAETRYFKGKSYEDVCRVYTELLHTTPNDLLALCEILKDVAKDNLYCVVAGQAQIDDCGEKIKKQMSV